MSEILARKPAVRLHAVKLAWCPQQDCEFESFLRPVTPPPYDFTCCDPDNAEGLPREKHVPLQWPETLPRKRDAPRAGWRLSWLAEWCSGEENAWPEPSKREAGEGGHWGSARRAAARGGAVAMTGGCMGSRGFQGMPRTSV